MRIAWFLLGLHWFCCEICVIHIADLQLNCVTISRSMLHLDLKHRLHIVFGREKPPPESLTNHWLHVVTSLLNYKLSNYYVIQDLFSLFKDRFGCLRRYYDNRCRWFCIVIGMLYQAQLLSYIRLKFYTVSHSHVVVRGCYFKPGVGWTFCLLGGLWLGNGVKFLVGCALKGT